MVNKLRKQAENRKTGGPGKTMKTIKTGKTGKTAQTQWACGIQYFLPW
jgi:hypothetical protein